MNNPSDYRLSDFLREVYVPSRIDLAADTIRQMEMTIRVFDRWAGRPLTLADLTEDRVRQFLAAYRAAPRSAASTNSKRCQILALWRCAWDEEYLPTPPRTRKVRKIKTHPNSPEAWTSEEVGRILTAAAATTGTIGMVSTPDWWRSLLLVIYDTGARKNEALKTAPHDLSLSGGWISLSSRKNGRRICPLHIETIEAVARIDATNRSLVWPWPYSREALDKRFKKILAMAGVPYGRPRGGLFHKLRRTSGTLVEASGGDGAKQIGDTRAVFERHYLDRRLVPQTQLDRLPRPR